MAVCIRIFMPELGKYGDLMTVNPMTSHFLIQTLSFSLSTRVRTGGVL
jgi:hypothetical protein